MAILTANQIARLGIELLKRRLVLPMTAARVQPAQLAGPSGGTVVVRVRQPRTANIQTSPGSDVSGNYADLAEIEVPVTVQNIYDGTKLSDYDLTLGIEDFGQQVLEPLISSVAAKAEDQVATALNALPADISFAASPSADDTRATVLAIREALTEAEVPQGNRYLAVSPSIATRILSVPEFVKADESGSTGALREATIGRLFGMTVIETNALTTDTAVGYHRSGIVWANRAPAEASGADSSTVTADGISLRAVRDHDLNTLSEVCVVSTFAGAALVYEDADESSPSDNKRFVKADVGSSSSS